MLRAPAAPSTPHTVILETPETLAILLTAYLSRGREQEAQTHLDGITAAAEAAIATVPHPWHLAGAEQHMTPDHDPGWPSPHVHLVVVDVESTYAVQQWAVDAHTAFQAALRCHVQAAGVGITLDTPTPTGWEVTALISRLGSLGRPRCVPPSSRVLYPADITGVRGSDVPHARPA